MGTTYNRFVSMPFIPYNIISHLANDPKAEDVWKILKYPTRDCLDMPNLTLKEKMALVWNGQDRQEDYNVYFTSMVGNMQLSNKTYIKLYQIDINPINKNMAKVCYVFDMIMGDNIAIIDYNGIPCNRIETLEAMILKSLNGADVGGVGVLSFDTDFSTLTRARKIIGNNSTFTGMSLIMGTSVSDNNDDTGC